MSSTPVRFIHATHLELDEPLIGTGSLAGEQRRIAEDASLLAFAKIVEVSVEKQADFLLLTGNIFTEKDLSLRGRGALHRGLTKLDEAEVAVFIMPGETDSAAAWRRLRLPDSVTVFDSEEDEPVDIASNGKVVATVFPIAGRASDETNWKSSGPAAMRSGTGPLKVGLVGEGAPVKWESTGPVAADRVGSSAAAVTLIQEAIQHGVDYIAVGGGPWRETHRLKHGIAHAPGSPQGRTQAQRGTHGCSLIEQRRDGTLHIDLIPTGPVRWESLEVDGDGASIEDLAQRMSYLLLDKQPAPGEKLWIIDWVVQGTGEGLESLAEARYLADLWEYIESEVPANGVLRQHRLTRDGKEEPREHSPLLAEFLDDITSQVSPHEAAWKKRTAKFEHLQTQWAAPLVRMADKLQPDRVLQEARRLARVWWQ